MTGDAGGSGVRCIHHERLLVINEDNDAEAIAHENHEIIDRLREATTDLKAVVEHEQVVQSERESEQGRLGPDSTP